MTNYELITNYITAIKRNMERDMNWCKSEIEFNDKLIDCSKKSHLSARFEQGVNVGLRHELRYDDSIMKLIEGLEECLERIQNDIK